MRSQGSFVVVLLLLLVSAGAWFLFAGPEHPGRPDLPDRAVRPGGVAAGRPEAATGVVEDQSNATAAGTSASGTRTVLESAPVEAASVLCTVSGRLVDREGQPRADVELRWNSWRSNADLGDLPIDRPRDSEKVIRSAVDGRFRFELARGRAGNLRLDVDRYVFAAGDARFSTAAGDTDLGDLRVVAPARIRGVVVDAAGQPVADVKVGVDQGGFGLGTRSESTSDQDGRFVVGALHAGAWNLRTASAQFLPATLRVELADEEQKDGVRMTVQRGMAIAGQVVDDLGRPIAEAQVGCMRRERSGGVSIERFTPDEATTTDANGFFTLAGLSADAVTVRATKKGHGKAIENQVAVGTGNLLMRLPRVGSIIGTLRDPFGNPLAGSRVTASAQRGSQPSVFEDLGVDVDLPGVDRQPRAVTAADGSFRIDDVIPGQVTVNARGKSHRPVSRTGLTVQPAQVLEGIALSAEIGAVVNALVVDENGAPVEGATVEVHEPAVAAAPSNSRFRTRSVDVSDDDGDAVVSIGGQPRRLGSDKTDEDGKATVAGLPAGDAVVTSTHPDLAESRSFATVLPVQGTVDVRLVLRRPGTARLTATTPDGEPASVAFAVHGPNGSSDEERDHKGKTDSNGKAVVGPLPPGDYWAELKLPPAAQHLGAGMMFTLGDADRGLRGTRVSFRVEAGQQTAIDLRMPQLTRVYGTVTGIDGAANGVAVDLESLDDEGPSGVPDIPGADKQSAVTGADGAFSIGDVVPGRYRIRWGKPDQLVKASALLDVPPGTPELLRDLELRFGKVQLRVVSAEDGEPIEGAEVELIEGSADGAPPPPRRRIMMVSIQSTGAGSETTSMTMGAARAETDIDGAAEIVDVPPGRYTVRIRHAQYAQRDVSDQVVLESATTDCGRIELGAAGRLRGRVVDANGEPVQVAMVSCRKVGGDGESQQQPALRGAFTFDGLPPGRYSLKAQSIDSGGGAAEGPELEAEVTAGKTTSDLRLVLPAR